MSSFARLATLTVSTKRHPALVGGKRPEPVLHLSGLMCIPLMPVDSEVRLRMGLDSPHELLQTFVDGDHDIHEGDYLTSGGIDYPIKAVAEWPWRGGVRKHLILEDLK